MPTRPPLRPSGIAFAFALNLLLVTLALFVGGAGNVTGGGAGGGTAGGLLAGLPLAAAIVAGLAASFYIRQRAAIHAALGGLLSVPVFALFLLPGNNWPFAVLLGAFCTVGGILGEYRHRRAK